MHSIVLLELFQSLGTVHDVPDVRKMTVVVISRARIRRYTAGLNPAQLSVITVPVVNFG